MNKLRHASSVILVTKNGLVKNPVAKANNISTLMLKRSQKSSHFPDSYVFPGGNCDPADENSEWLKVFPKSELDVQLNLMEKLFECGDKSVLPKAVSRRITAIRETFEECGILLCKRESDPTKLVAKNYHIENKNIWRDKIRNDPFEFYNFCKTNNCFPNLKSLHLLSNWITPTAYSKRFNSIFFIVAVGHEIESEADYKEIEEVKWGQCNYFIENEDIFLPPPQQYELTKLQNFISFDVLCEFIEKLDGNTCEAYLPAHVIADDGFIMVLPGDEQYEKLSNGSIETPLDVNCDISNYRGKIMNRVEYRYPDGLNEKHTKANVIILNEITNNFTDSTLQSKL